jgi:3-methyl-2-oxobutanoate hydroxymethyltransferase
MSEHNQSPVKDPADKRAYPHGSALRKRIRTRHFSAAKEQGIRITGLTSYDQFTAQIFDTAGVDFLLVGDSAANNVFGFETTLPVTLDELIPLTRAVAAATSRAFVIADMPFGSYEVGVKEAVRNAIRFMKETGAHAVKLEGGIRSAKKIRHIVNAGIPVMAHVGFTPQSEHGLGGHLIQGRGAEASEQLLADAKAVEDAGAFAVVLEMVSAETARHITKNLKIPTIGVGAGPHVDGQLVVWTDWAGLSTGRIPKFVRQYANLKNILSDATTQYISDVTEGLYPGPEHSYE